MKVSHLGAAGLAAVLLLTASAVRSALPVPPRPLDASAQTSAETDEKPAEPAPAQQPTKATHEQIAAAAEAAGLRPLLEAKPHGGINWSRGVLYALGEGRARSEAAADVAAAKRAARLVAARNALLLMRGVRVSSDGRFADVRDGVITVDGVLESFREVYAEFNPSTRTAHVLLEAPLLGPGGVLPTVGVRLQANRGRGWDWPSDEDAGSCDVVIIDARELKMVPTLSPQILTDGGQRVFGPADIPANELNARPAAVFMEMEVTGVSRDARSVVGAPLARARVVTGEAGRIDPQLQEMAGQAFRNPLILTASGVAENSHGSLVLSSSAEKQLMLHGEARRLMREGRIVIVLDKIPTTAPQP